MCGCDQLHAAGEAQVGAGGDGVEAQVVVVFGVAIADRLAARFPAAAVGTKRKRADRAEELVMRIRFPMSRFAAAGDDDARAMARPAGPRGDGGREAHGERDGT